MRTCCSTCGRSGACLGLHLHPYKLKGGKYKHDLGAYAAGEQARDRQRGRCRRGNPRWAARPVISGPVTFRPMTLRSAFWANWALPGAVCPIPGRVLPGHYSVWAGADIYPHRVASRNVVWWQGKWRFHQCAGVRGMRAARYESGHAGERGYEWPYVPHSVRSPCCNVKNVLDRFLAEKPRFPVIVTDTHNDQDYSDPEHPASRNLELILKSIRDLSASRWRCKPVGNNAGCPV